MILLCLVQTCSPRLHLEPHARNGLLEEAQDQTLEHVQVTTCIKVPLGWAQFKDDSKAKPMSRQHTDHVRRRGVLLFIKRNQCKRGSISIVHWVIKTNEKSSEHSKQLIYSAAVSLFFIAIPKHTDASVPSFHVFKNYVTVKIRHLH
jgi:hypothetical protein